MGQIFTSPDKISSKLAKSPLIIGEEGEEYALFIIRKSGDGLKLKISLDS